MHRVMTVIALVGISTSVAVLAQPHPMRPGRWEVTASMQMAAMTMPPMTSTQCITAEDLKKGREGGTPAGFSGGQQGNCKISDYAETNNTVSWKMQCSGANASSGEARMMFKGDTYDGTMTMTTAQGAMTMKMAGKRVGDCTK